MANPRFLIRVSHKFYSLSRVEMSELCYALSMGVYYRFPHAPLAQLSQRTRVKIDRREFYDLDDDLTPSIAGDLYEDLTGKRPDR